MRKIVELNIAEIRDVVGGLTAVDYKVATSSVSLSSTSVSMTQTYQAPTATTSSSLLVRR